MLPYLCIVLAAKPPARYTKRASLGAAWFWHRRAGPIVAPEWAFIGQSQSKLHPPRQEPLRLRRALAIGSVGGLLFGVLLTALHFTLGQSAAGACRDVRIKLHAGLFCPGVHMHCVAAQRSFATGATTTR